MKNCSCLLLVVLLLPAAAPAQTSIGFSDPDDISNLIDYRLPDWGYRIWDLGFAFDSRGRESEFDQTVFNFRLNSLLEMYGESEQKVWSVGVATEGSFYRRDYDHDNPLQDNYRRALDGAFDVGAQLQKYVSSSTSYIVRGDLGVQYSEDVSERRGDRMSNVERGFTGFGSAGFALGRLRNVTPLLRAQRLSERLRELGRRELSSREVRRLAEVLARESGYRTVFDRGNKDFWRDVFAAFDLEEPLTPYEILYLTEVLAEDVGFRNEGFLASLSGSADRMSNGWERTTAGPLLQLDWSHNYDLAHQLSLRLRGYYRWEVDDPGRSDMGGADFDVAYLWALADRVLWTNRLSHRFGYQQDNERDRLSRMYRVDFMSDYSIFIEDQLRLLPHAGLGYETRDSTGNDAIEYWDWEVGVTLAYALDNLLY